MEREHLRSLRAKGSVRRGGALRARHQKVTQEVEAEADGVLLGILITDGEVEVGTTVALDRRRGRGRLGGVRRAPTTEQAPSAPAPTPPERRRGGGSAPQPARRPRTAPAPANGRVKASPLARRMARERGVDLHAIVGTGPDGGVVAQDVEQAAARWSGCRRRPRRRPRCRPRRQRSRSLQPPAIRAHDRAPSHGGVDGAGLPARGRGRHGRGARALRDARRSHCRGRREAHGQSDLLVDSAAVALLAIARLTPGLHRRRDHHRPATC